MTSSTLISKTTTQVASIPTMQCSVQSTVQSTIQSTIQSEVHLSVVTPKSTALLTLEPKPNKFPYQANHRAELLNLHAETEALLQHLHILKQQRLASTLRQAQTN